jgi:RND superfamily putative drug exporter
MFDLLGQWIARRSPVLILVWILAIVGAATWAWRTGEMPPGEIGSFLPADSEYNRAVALTGEAFPKLPSRSYIAVISERKSGLTKEDIAWLDRVASGSARTHRDITKGIYLSPAVFFLEPRLVNDTRQAAIALINLSCNYITPGAIEVVESVDRIASKDRPEGLTVEITGPGGIGRDYAVASEQALHNTTYVTIAAVLIILILVYRSPVGALVPLVAIGASVYLAFVFLTFLATRGWPVSDFERVFAVVLLFGAGIDYALFWIARYREELVGHLDLNAAAHTSTCRSSPAILASAATTICGLSTLMIANLVPFKHAGNFLAPVLVISLLAALTLTPAIARSMGRWLLWPLRTDAVATLGQRYFWPTLATFVTRRPRTILIVGLIVLGAAGAAALRFEAHFASLSQLPSGSSSQRGYQIAESHFKHGQLYPNTLSLLFDHRPDDDRLDAISSELTEGILKITDVESVLSLTSPHGQSPKDPDETVWRRAMIDWLDGLDPSRIPQIRALYVSQEPPVLRFDVFINKAPFAREAMDIVDRVRQQAEELAVNHEAADNPSFKVMLTGFTPYIMGVRDVADADQIRVMLLATAVIAIIVLVLVRDVPLTLFMVLATWLTCGATLTLSHLFFVHVMDGPGLDYKVRLIVFVIVMAVGQDYNIFLVTRLIQESPEISPTEAAHRAIVRTGSVISSCGLIMAATLGSLWAGGLSLLQELGFALAVGILIDTFFVRPLLIPSFFLATGRGQKGRKI